MKTFSTLLNTEKNKKTGAAPVWILKVPFVAGTLYLSDRVFTYTGITIKPWIASWGAVDEDITDEMGSPQVSDFAVDIIIDPDEATDIHDLLWSEAVETLRCELYLWFEGLTVATDPMVLMWAGNIVDFEKLNELVYGVRLVDESVRIDKYPGRVLSLADYAYASLDDVGCQMTILYGSVEKVPALRVEAGAFTTLAEDLTALDTLVSVTEASGFSALDKIKIGTETAIINSILGNILTCWRGYTSDLTSAGSEVAASTASRYYGMCAAPNGDVYAFNINGLIYKQALGAGTFTDMGVTSLDYRGMCAAPDGDIYVCVHGGDIYKQTAGAGDFNALSQTTRDWTGMAATPSGNIYACVAGGDIYKQTNGAGDFEALGQTSRTWKCMSASVNGHVYAIEDTRYVYKQTSGAGDFNQVWDLAVSPGAICAAPNGDVYVSADYAAEHIWKQTGGTGDFIETTIDSDDMTGICISAAGNWYMSYNTVGVNKKIYTQTGTASTHAFGETVQTTGVDCVYMFADHPVKSIGTIYLIDLDGKERDVTSFCTKYTGQGGANDLSGYAGKAVIVYQPDYDVGDKLLITGEGYQDGGAALIERPDLIMEHFLYTYCAWPTADFEHTDAAVALAADSYKFSVVINTRKRMKEWLAYMALQCRCWFRFAGGKSYLLYRTDTLTSDKTITAAMIRMNDDFTTTARISRSPLDEIINKISLYYSRDWSKPEGMEAYQAITSASDATSITAYGEKEKPDLFLFDFIRDATMAADVRAFYLARYKDRKKVVTFDLFLDNAELEFADALTITPLGALVGEVRKVNFAPGSGRDMRNDMIAITMREY
jgi:hypothetical protein